MRQSSGRQLAVHESEDIDSRYRPCDACGQLIDLDRGAPEPDRATQPSTVLSTETRGSTTKTFYELGTHDAGQGCPRCGCPSWRRGGKLGDAAGGLR